MKSIKTAIAAIATLATTASFGGLYIVAGGDFRMPVAEYVIYTAQNNETVNISPKQGPTPWSVKVEGQEIQGTNGQYTAYTFPAAGYHKVRLYCAGNASRSGTSATFSFGFGYSGYTTPDSVKAFKEIKFYGNVNITPGYLNMTNYIFKDSTKVFRNQCAFTQWGTSNSNHQVCQFIGKTPVEFEYESFAFSGFKKFEIPATVETIGYSAFSHSRIQDLTLPNKNIQINTEMHVSTPRKNFTSVFRKCPITKVRFRGTLAEWNANDTYKYIFGEATGEPDGQGGYTLSYSEYAQALHAEIADNVKYDLATPAADEFAKNSQAGLIKLYLISE